MTETPSRWRCATCGRPVELARAREHYDRCVASDPPEVDTDENIEGASE